MLLAACPAQVILVMLFTALTLHDNSFTEHVFGNLPCSPLDSRTMQHLLGLKPLVKVGNGQVQVYCQGEALPQLRSFQQDATLTS